MVLYLTCTTITSVDLAHYGVSRAKDWLSVDCGTIQIKVVKILQELAESEPKAHPIHQREDGTTYLNKQQDCSSFPNRWQLSYLF